MLIVRVLGKVLPEAVVISWDKFPVLRFSSPDGAFQQNTKIKLDCSRIEVEIELIEYSPERLNGLFNHAYDLASAYVDMISFARGYGLFVVLESVVHPDGTTEKVVNGTPSLAQHSTAFKFPMETPEEGLAFAQVLKKVMAEPALYYALHDLIRAINIPNLAAINCGRVLDGLRKILAPDEDPKRGWPILQATLNVDAAYCRFISDQSKNPRHGDRTFIPGATTGETMKRTWIIMNRFLELRKRNDTTLPINEFPLLQG
jgi:hypothetical protein